MFCLIYGFTGCREGIFLDGEAMGSKMCCFSSFSLNLSVQTHSKNRKSLNFCSKILHYTPFCDVIMIKPLRFHCGGPWDRDFHNQARHLHKNYTKKSSSFPFAMFSFQLDIYFIFLWPSTKFLNAGSCYEKCDLNSFFSALSNIYDFNILFWMWELITNGCFIAEHE